MSDNKIKIEDESGDKKYFTIIPNYIYNHSTHWDREVYSQMKRIAGEDGDCWISQENLAKQCGISVGRLKRSLKYLIDHKWIVFIGKRKSNKNDTEGTNVYKISNLWKLNMEFYDNKKAVSPEDSAFSKGGVTGTEKAVSPGDYKEEPYKEDNTSVFPEPKTPEGSFSEETQENSNNPIQGNSPTPTDTPPPPPPNPVHCLVERFKIHCKAIYGFTPDVADRDYGIIKNTRKKYKDEEIEDMFIWYLRLPGADKRGVLIADALSIRSINKYKATQ